MFEISPLPPDLAHIKNIELSGAQVQVDDWLTKQDSIKIIHFQKTNF